MKNQTRWMLAITIAAGAVAARAADVTWSNETGDGLWSTPGNWSTRSCPGENDRALIGSDVTLDIDTTVNAVLLSNSPAIEGAGHTLTVLSGSVTGGSKPVVRCALAFPEGVAANVGVAQGYGNFMIVAGGVSGGASVSSLGGNQNYGIWFTNGTVRTGEMNLNIGSSFFSPLDVDRITLMDPWADGNGNYPTYSFWPEAVLSADTELATFRGKVALAFNNQYHDDPVEFSIPTLRLRGGTWTSLGCNFWGGRNFVSVGNLVRESGTVLNISYSRRGSENIDYGVNAGIAVPGLQTDAAGLAPAWVYSDVYRVRRLEGGVLVPTTIGDYTALGESIAADDPAALCKLDYVRSSALTASSTMNSLVLNGNFGGDTMYLDLGGYDLTLAGGNLAMRDYAPKTITATGGGRLVIAADQAVFNFTYGVTRIEISAPIAWAKPAGSSVEYPDFLVPMYQAQETVFSGKDLVGDWGAFFAEGNGSWLVFDGPSDRTFHGVMGGRFWMRKRGSGTLTFAGPSVTRGCQINVEAGTVSIANNDAPSISVVTNGAAVRVESGIVWNGTAGVWKDGILEGTGTLNPGLNQNYLQPQCILRGGTAEAPGTFSFGGQVVIPTNIVLATGFSGETHGQIHVGGKLTFRKDLDTEVVVRVSDVDKTASVKKTDKVVVLDWAGSLENYSDLRISFRIENASPKTLDVANAVAVLDTSSKTISITGMRSVKRGFTISVR